jgi:hypothetical protein
VPIAKYKLACRAAFVEDLLLLFVAGHALRLASRWPEKWRAKTFWPITWHIGTPQTD